MGYLEIGDQKKKSNKERLFEREQKRIRKNEMKKLRQAEKPNKSYDEFSKKYDKNKKKKLGKKEYGY